MCAEHRRLAGRNRPNLPLVCTAFGTSAEDAKVREPDLLQLAQIASTYPKRQRFLTELTLDPPSATSDDPGVPHVDEDYLILSTIHSAKGQEWKSVFVLNCVDGCIPSDLATESTPEIEEERRLLYVAMTRAKDHLHLRSCRNGSSRISSGVMATGTCTPSGTQDSSRTRCSTISSDARGRQQSTKAHPRATTPPNPVDLGARLKQMWR